MVCLWVSVQPTHLSEIMDRFIGDQCCQVGLKEKNEAVRRQLCSWHEKITMLDTKEKKRWFFQGPDVCYLVDHAFVILNNKSVLSDERLCCLFDSDLSKDFNRTRLEAFPNWAKQEHALQHTTTIVRIGRLFDFIFLN